MKKLLGLLALFCALSGFAADRIAYIKHSSGLVIANSAGRAVILNPEADGALPVLISDTPDGWLNIAVAGDGGASLYLTRTGSWNTSFASDPNIDEAKFQIDGDPEGYVRIRCKANGCYLGTDADTSGSNVYSDKDGGDIKHQWFVTEDINGTPDLSTVRYTIDTANLRQTTEGWGVSLCWWANMCGHWTDKHLDKIIDWLVSPSGLNYNIFRYNIGGGDDPDNAHCTPHHMGNGKGLRAEMEGFKDSSDDVYHWDRDEAQRRVMLKIREKRPDAIFEAFSNTPPWYMTYSGCCSGAVDGGQDNLRPEYYEEFAHYLVDVCVHYRDVYGLEFRTLEPFNESNSTYWYCNGVQEGCHFEWESQIAFLKVLHPILKASGLNTEIAASDETAVWPALFGFRAYRDAGILDMVGQWNTHTYWGSNDDRINYSALVRPTGARLWMSETGSGGNGLAGNLSMAQRLIDDIRYLEPDAWLDWQYMEEKNDQWCMVQGSFEEETARKVKNFYVRQHFSRYIKAGYTFVGTDNEQTLAALSPKADTLVVVSLNTMPIEQNMVATLRGFAPGSASRMVLTDENNSLSRIYTFEYDDATGRLSYTLPKQSVVTLQLVADKEEGISDATIQALRWRVDGGVLHVVSPDDAALAVHTAAGALVYSGTVPASLSLPHGVYLLSSPGSGRPAATIAL